MFLKDPIVFVVRLPNYLGESLGDAERYLAAKGKELSNFL